MWRGGLRVVVVSLAWGCGTDPLDGLTLVEMDRSDLAIPGLDADWQRRFDRGDALFGQPFREATGLGPNYIRPACSSCHAEDGRGPGVVEKFAFVEADGVTPSADQPLPWGHTARPQVAGGARTPLDAPDAPGLLFTTRAPTPVFGRGYLEAIDPAAVAAVSAAQAAAGRVSGRPNAVAWRSAVGSDPEFFAFQPGDSGLFGRFGLKARVASLDDFAADALQGDMSITSPMRPSELPNPDGLTDDALPGVDVELEVVRWIADYTRLVDIPPREALPGEALFADVGCADCHTPALPTRPDYPIPALAGIEAPVFTDLLLHDMGQASGDGLVDESAGSTEWRTAPLIGLRFLRSYLHDGRASSVEAAIVLHRGVGSEANASIDAFDALSAADRATLVAWTSAL